MKFDVLLAVGVAPKATKSCDEIPLMVPNVGDFGVGQAEGKGDAEVLFVDRSVCAM